MSCTLSTNSGSVDSLNVSDRWGRRPNAPRSGELWCATAQTRLPSSGSTNAWRPSAWCSVCTQSAELPAHPMLCGVSPHDIRRLALQCHQPRTAGAIFLPCVRGHQGVRLLPYLKALAHTAAPLCSDPITNEAPCGSGPELRESFAPRQVAELQIRAAILNSFTALKTPETHRVA